MWIIFCRHKNCFVLEKSCFLACKLHKNCLLKKRSKDQELVANLFISLLQTFISVKLLFHLGITVTRTVFYISIFLDLSLGMQSVSLMLLTLNTFRIDIAEVLSNVHSVSRNNDRSASSFQHYGS